MILTDIEKVSFADEVLRIMQDAQEEIDDVGCSDFQKKSAKLSAYERIRELLKY